MKSSQAKIAEALATAAHEGQFDKAGVPYICHPRTVACHMHGDEGKAVAWLHDVLEDTSLTERDLADAGINRDVIEAVKAMTHRRGEAYSDFICRVKENRLAASVKIADLRHNMDLSRLPHVSDDDLSRHEKYKAALEFLLA